MRVAGKRVLITGGTAGIGLEFARACRAAGAQVSVSSRSAEACARAAAEGFDAVVGDVTTPDGRRRILEAQQALDVLVNNAGVQILLDYRNGVAAEDVVREMQTNLEGPLELIRLALPGLLLRPEAAIINVTSGLALVPKASAPVYCATKAALRSFTRSLRWQLEGTPVRVVEVLPPLVDTQMTHGRGRNKLSPQQCARLMLAGVEAGRDEILVGRSRLLAAVNRIWPARAEMVMRNS